MIRGLIILLAFQGAGEIVSRLFALPVPGPVIGLVLLLIFLIPHLLTLLHVLRQR